MICAVLLQNQVQDSVVLLALNPAFSVAPIESPRYGGLQSASCHEWHTVLSDFCVIC